MYWGKKNKHTGLKLAAGAVLLAGTAVFMQRLAKATEEPETIDDGNMYLKDHAFAEAPKEATADELPAPTFYEKYGKCVIDKTLAFCGLVALAPVYGAIALAIEIDDPGPVLFKQKRVGKDKHFFEMHKFRTMKTSAPKDVPAELFEDQEDYITRLGRFLRKTALDELPQLWDVFRGKMSLVGPRPVLWNTEELITKRELYHANDIKPGMTGLAQVNGRDRLDNVKKAEMDGLYVKGLREGGIKAFKQDINCLISTAKLLKDELER